MYSAELTVDLWIQTASIERLAKTDEEWQEYLDRKGPKTAEKEPSEEDVAEEKPKKKKSSGGPKQKPWEFSYQNGLSNRHLFEQGLMLLPEEWKPKGASGRLVNSRTGETITRDPDLIWETVLKEAESKP